MARGSIIKKKDVYYCVIPFRDPITNKDRRKWIKVGTSEKEAERFLTELMYEANRNGGYVEPSKMTVKEFLEYWLQKYVKRNVRKNTQDSYETFIRAHIIPEIGHILLRKLHHIHIDDLLDKKLEGGRADGKAGGLSERSVKYIYSILHEAFAYAVKKEIMTINPTDKVTPPRQQKKKVIVWTTDEIQRFFEVARNNRFYTLFMLAISTGMRRGELLALSWRNIEFREGLGVINVEYTLSKKRTLQPVKTEESQRAVIITPAMVDLLKRHKKKQIEERLAAGQTYQDYNLVFCSKNGSPLNAENIVKRYFYPLIKEANVRRITFHGLRHCSATIALAGDASMKIIQRRLGHTTIKTTGDIYTHPAIDAQYEVAATIDKVIFNEKKPGVLPG
ncbi:MAG: Tyrosine recombinase XerD [Pelotomaculum sp. PtaU1.Bin065]|nr:MAG: Tyrosine recombinase XerD [Pelotomaculum sp. PtaU1.Bin065]